MPMPGSEPNEHHPASPNGSPPASNEYFHRMLAEASRADPDALQRAAASLTGRVIRLVVETAQEDESFYLVYDDGSIHVLTTAEPEEPSVTVRITPAVVRNILQGELTPVEAFFMGKLRARGTTRNLYAFQRFFLDFAEIGASSPAILDLVDDFEQRKC